MNRKYQIAGHLFEVSGEELCKAIDEMEAFKPFETNKGDVLFSIVQRADVPSFESIQYEFGYEDVMGEFGRTHEGWMLSLAPAEESTLYMWNVEGEQTIQIYGNFSTRLYRFALWVAFGLMTLPYHTVAIHSSCIVCHNQAFLFLGESGTGKSTHTRLWRENIADAFLLNDDSPIIRVEDGKVWAYGSPWSGKTPCYKQERYELKGCVRLSQAPFNHIKKLFVLEAYGAIHPSCPPEFAYDDTLYDYVGNLIDKLISAVPFYHLACLPDREASILSYQTLLNDEADTE